MCTASDGRSVIVAGAHQQRLDRACRGGGQQCGVEGGREGERDECVI